MKSITTIFLRTLLFCGTVALLTGCAHQTPAISPTAQPDRNAAVVFGRFSIGREYNFGNRLALWLQNLDAKKSVYIYFDLNRPVYGVEIKPGRYQLAGFVGVNNTREIKGRVTFPASRFTAPFTASAGEQIYLGDFSGVASYDGMMSQWRVNSVTNNFANTAVEFREQYRNLMVVPAVSVFELPASRP